MFNPSSEESEGCRVVKMWWNKVEERVHWKAKRLNLSSVAWENIFLGVLLKLRHNCSITSACCRCWGFCVYSYIQLNFTILWLSKDAKQWWKILQKYFQVIVKQILSKQFLAIRELCWKAENLFISWQNGSGFFFFYYMCPC